MSSPYQIAQELLARWPKETPLSTIPIPQLESVLSRVVKTIESGQQIKIVGAEASINPSSAVSGETTIWIKTKGTDVLVNIAIELGRKGDVKTLLQTLFHEFVHISQFIKMITKNKDRILGMNLTTWMSILDIFPVNYEDSSDKSYWTDPMEVDAYAKEIAQTIKEEGIGLDQIKELLKSPKELIEAIGNEPLISWYFNEATVDQKNKMIHSILKQL
jgi:hypothetical protein